MEGRSNSYLIPANTKKSQLILGFFTPVDLAIFSVGCVVSFTLIVLQNTVNLPLLIILLMPGLVATFLVMPVPHYHNVLQLLTNIYNFYTGRRQYYWKGWCVNEKYNTNSK